MFDGRNVIDVKTSNDGRGFIGAYNKQIALTVTERDTSGIDNAEDTVYPTKDSVSVVAYGTGKFTLTSDPVAIKKYYNVYGRRTWCGEPITSQDGQKCFNKTKVVPAFTQAKREVIGGYDAIQLNSLAQYIQNANAVITNGEVKKVDNNQVLNEVQRKIGERAQQILTDNFNGNKFYENVGYQNLRIGFEGGVQEQIAEAQAKRTETATAKLEAQRQVAEAAGRASVAVERAKGARQAAFQQAQAYRLNPNQAKIDRIKALCGDDGCDPQILGGSDINTIVNLK